PRDEFRVTFSPAGRICVRLTRFPERALSGLSRQRFRPGSPRLATGGPYDCTAPRLPSVRAKPAGRPAVALPPAARAVSRRPAGRGGELGLSHPRLRALGGRPRRLRQPEPDRLAAAAGDVACPGCAARPQPPPPLARPTRRRGDGARHSSAPPGTGD